MKKVKLSRKQLRQIISEALTSREPGSPLWSPPAEKPQINEAVDGIYEMIMDLIHQVTLQWKFNPDDPSQAAIGEEGWQQQLDAAEEDMLNEIAEVVDRVQTKLTNGEYYDGGGSF